MIVPPLNQIFGCFSSLRLLSVRPGSAYSSPLSRTDFGISDLMTGRGGAGLNCLRLASRARLTTADPGWKL